MTSNDNIFDVYAQAYESQKQHRMSLREYLEGCRSDPSMYAGTAERMLRAIGEPELVDTSKDARLGRIFMNRTVKVYAAFKDFYGLEETIERIVGFFRHAAQGLEEKKQIRKWPLRGLVSATSVGLVQGHTVADLDYLEDTAADVDMNVVCLSDGRFVEVQGSAEGSPFDLPQFQAMLDLARRSCEQVHAAQKAVLGL